MFILYMTKKIGHSFDTVLIKKMSLHSGKPVALWLCETEEHADSVTHAWPQRRDLWRSLWKLQSAVHTGNDQVCVNRVSVVRNETLERDGVYRFEYSFLILLLSKLAQDNRMESPIPILPLSTPDVETEKLIKMKDEEVWNNFCGFTKQSVFWFLLQQGLFFHECILDQSQVSTWSRPIVCILKHEDDVSVPVQA